MPTAIIQSTINGVGIPIVGSRDDVQKNVDTVYLSHKDSASTYFWEFLSKPPASIATLSSASASVPTFTPDKVGSYLVRLTVDGDTAGADVRVIAVKTVNLGIRIPAAGETNEYDNNPITGVDGWHEALYNAFITLDDQMIRADGTGAVPTAAFKLNGQRITNLGAPSLGSDAARFQDIPTNISDFSGTSTLVQLNAHISDATLDDSASTRTPTSHSLGSSFHTAITLAELNSLILDATLDDENDPRTIVAHGLGDSYHTSTTLADLNALISDATLDNSGNPRQPIAHGLGDSLYHIPTILSDLNTLISDATLLDAADVTLDLAYNNGQVVDLDSGAIKISGSSNEVRIEDAYVSLGKRTDPALISGFGHLYTKDVFGNAELFFMDEYGVTTQITDDGYLDTFNSLRGVGLWEQVSDPPLVEGKAYLYAKNNDGNTELFFQDSSGNIAQMTSLGFVNGDSINFDNYAEKNLLDSYATPSVVDGYALTSSLDVYAEKTLLDSYATTTDFSIYAEKALLDSYATPSVVDGYALASSLSVYAEKSTLDAYALANATDGYALVSETVGLPEQVSDPAFYDNYGTLYAKDVDGYTELFYLDNYGNSIPVTRYGEPNTLSSFVLQLSGSGLLTGGLLSINSGDNTKFDLAAGKGYIVDGYSNPEAPTLYEVEWDAQTAITPVGLGSTSCTFIAIDQNGEIVQQTTLFTSHQVRELIVLGHLLHFGGTQVEAVIMRPVPAFCRSLSLIDLSLSIGVINRGGNVYTANGANLNIDKSSGETYRLGTNYENDRQSPSISVDPLGTALSFRYYYRDGSGGFTASAPTTSIDPNNYDSDTGTPVSVPNNRYSIQRIFYCGSLNLTFIHYGQTTYGSLAAAEAAIAGENLELDPKMLAEATLRAFLIVKKGTTDLTNTANAKFISANKFGTGPAGGISFATTDLQGAYNNGSEPEIILNATHGAISIQDNSTPIGANLFEVSSNGGTIDYFSISSERTWVDGYVSLVKKSDPTADSDVGHLYTKEDDGYVELFYMDDYGTPIQITEKNYVASFNLGATILEDSVFTSDFTAKAGFHYKVDPTGGAIVIYLPIAANNYGKTIIVKNKSDSNNQIQLLPNGSDTIDGETSVEIIAARSSIVLRSDGVDEWMVV